MFVDEHFRLLRKQRKGNSFIKCTGDEKCNRCGHTKMGWGLFENSTLVQWLYMVKIPNYQLHECENYVTEIESSHGYNFWQVSERK